MRRIATRAFWVPTIVIAVAVLGHSQESGLQESHQSDEQLLRATIQQLQDENALLRKQVKAKLAVPTSSIRELEQMLSTQFVRLSELAKVSRELQTDRRVQSELTRQQLAGLQDRWQVLDQSLRSIEAKYDTSPADLISSQTLSDRVATAELDNRLRLIEARATVDVLGQNRSKLEQYARDEARIAIQRTSLLLEQRKEELRIAQRKMSGSKDREARAILDNQVEFLKLGVRDAELVKKEAELQFTSSSRDFDARIVEAKIRVEVAERVAAEIKGESSRVANMVAASKEMFDISNRRDAVRQKLTASTMSADEIVSALRAKEIAVQTQIDASSKMLDEIELKKLQLVEELGKGHPALSSVDRQIELLNNILQDVRAEGKTDSSPMSSVQEGAGQDATPSQTIAPEEKAVE